MAETTKKVSSGTPKDEGSNNTLVEREEVLNDIRKALEERFNNLREQAEKASSIWMRYDIDVVLKELKYLYENVIK